MRNPVTIGISAVTVLVLLVLSGVSLRVHAQTAASGPAHWFRGTGTAVKVTKVGIPLQVMASFALPAGSWSLVGTATVAANDVMGTDKVIHKASVSCSFADGADGFTVAPPSPSGTFGFSTGMMTPVSFAAALTFSSPLTVTLSCNKSDALGDVGISNIQLIAVPVSSVLRH
jgi:hypothetical protein